MRNLDPAVFDPQLAGNLTYIIQGLIVLFVSAPVLVTYLSPGGCGEGCGADGGRRAAERRMSTTSDAPAAAARRHRRHGRLAPARAAGARVARSSGSAGAAWRSA